MKLGLLLVPCLLVTLTTTLHVVDGATRPSKQGQGAACDTFDHWYAESITVTSQAQSSSKGTASKHIKEAVDQQKVGPAKPLPVLDLSEESKSSVLRLQGSPVSAKYGRLAQCKNGMPPMYVARDFENDSIYSGVVKFWLVNTQSNTWSNWCSGWLISPTLIGTAAHCLHNGRSFYQAGNIVLVAGFGLNGPTTNIICGGQPCPDTYHGDTYVDTNWTTVPAKYLTVFTDWTHSPDPATGADIGLVELQMAAPGWALKYGWQDPNPLNPGYRWLGYPAEAQPGYLLTSDMTFDSGVYCSQAYANCARNLMLVRSAGEGGCSGGPLFNNFDGSIIVGLTSATSDAAGDCPIWFTIPYQVGSKYTIDGLVTARGHTIAVGGGVHRVSS